MLSKQYLNEINQCQEHKNAAMHLKNKWLQIVGIRKKETHDPNVAAKSHGIFAIE